MLMASPITAAAAVDVEVAALARLVSDVVSEVDEMPFKLLVSALAAKGTRDEDAKSDKTI